MRASFAATRSILNSAHDAVLGVDAAGRCLFANRRCHELIGLPVGSPSLGELLNQGKANLQAPWLGISGFIVIASMLSLLVFIGEVVRDAFDPRKVYR